MEISWRKSQVDIYPNVCGNKLLWLFVYSLYLPPAHTVDSNHKCPLLMAEILSESFTSEHVWTKYIFMLTF